jgi:hypothetical protein
MRYIHTGYLESSLFFLIVCLSLSLYPEQKLTVHFYRESNRSPYPTHSRSLSAVFLPDSLSELIKESMSIFKEEPGCGIQASIECSNSQTSQSVVLTEKLYQSWRTNGCESALAGYGISAGQSKRFTFRAFMVKLPRS